MSLQAAFDAYQRQDFDTARQLLPSVLAAEPHNEDAWTLQMYVASSDAEKRDALRQVLRLNPKNQYALQMQAQLGEDMPSVPSPSHDTSSDVYEMMWDCKYCGTEKLLGVTHRYCPNCGGVQDSEQRYFPSDEEKIAVQDHQFVGADKVCEACETPNAGNAEFCTNCGSPMSDAARAKQLSSELRAEGDAFDQSHEKDQQTREKQHTAEEAEKAAKTQRTKWIIIGVVVALLAFIAVFIFWTKEVSVIATGHAWERSVSIDDYDARHKGDWCDSTPSDAYSLSRTKKVRSHKQVPDGQECSTRRVDQGDGTYREQQECRTKYRKEPVYDMYCHYTVDRWEYSRTAQAKEQGQKPYWPRYQLRCEDQRRKGCEREGGRSESYVLLLQNTDTRESYECDVKKGLWTQARVKSQWKLNVSGMTGGARCSSLQPL